MRGLIAFVATAALAAALGTGLWLLAAEASGLVESLISRLPVVPG